MFKSLLGGPLNPTPNVKRLIASSIRTYKCGILPAYQARVASGELRKDAHQLAVIKQLSALNESLLGCPGPPPEPSITLGWLLKRLLRIGQRQPLVPGLYLHGDVGCGKTMLMDLFYEHCAVNASAKRRIHFHAFMHEFHNRLHLYKVAHRMKLENNGSVVPMLNFNPIPDIAKEILAESWLLCLDEFQVTDIGDAMILRHVFKELFNRGMVMIATSNRSPDELYKNGLQRSNFLPFIPMLKKHCTVVQLESGIDYRRMLGDSGAQGQMGGVGKHLKIFHLNDAESAKNLDILFKVLANEETDTVRSKTLTIKNRNVTFAKTCGQVLDATFSELCDQPLGSGDYLAISQAFHTIIIRDIPKLDLRNRTQARRFITMVDTFYDNRNRVLFSADGLPDELFSCKGASSEASDDARKLMDDLSVSDANAAIFSGEEEVFAFYRTLSRLAQMQSSAYWNEAGRKK